MSNKINKSIYSEDVELFHEVCQVLEHSNINNITSAFNMHEVRQPFNSFDVKLLLFT